MCFASTEPRINMGCPLWVRWRLGKICPALASKLICHTMADAFEGANMTPLKLSAIDQEHLQELYDASGVARDELPYTESFETLWVGFQDRTFKNAGRDQVYAALLKYTRSSSNASKP